MKAATTRIMRSTAVLALIAHSLATPSRRTRVFYRMKTKLRLGLGAIVDDDRIRRARAEKILLNLADIVRRIDGRGRE
jgi:hypothetical protein